MPQYRLPDFGVRITGSETSIDVNDDRILLDDHASPRRWHRQDLADSSVSFLLGDPRYTRESVAFQDAVRGGEAFAGADFHAGARVERVTDGILAAADGVTWRMVTAVPPAPTTREGGARLGLDEPPLEDDAIRSGNTAIPLPGGQAAPDDLVDASVRPGMDRLRGLRVRERHVDLRPCTRESERGRRLADGVRLGRRQRHRGPPRLLHANHINGPRRRRSSAERHDLSDVSARQPAGRGPRHELLHVDLTHHVSARRRRAPAQDVHRERPTCP
jgi:hypothetical protein